uniref:Interferon-related developmental regulator N-terminal domain-containing protein n=1 Tax=Leersia perrieri TaxID=77586 RepID=A0A0D9VDU4_9ORYZ
MARSGKLWKPENTGFAVTSVSLCFNFIERGITDLFEKRRSTRVAAMEGLIDELERFRASAAAEFGRKYATVVSRCVFSLKKGSFKEACLAYRVIGLLAVTLAAGAGDGDGGGEVSVEAKEVLAEAFPFLARTVEASSDMARVVAAVNGLAAATFAGADGDGEIEKSMDAIWRGVIAGEARKTMLDALAAAVSAWAFLLAAVHDRYESSSSPEDDNSGENTYNDKIEHLINLVDTTDDIAVRLAAGEAIAACVELNLTHSTSPQDMESLKTTISNLAADHATGDKDTFQQIEAYLDDGESPSKLIHTSLTRQGFINVTTWTKLLQLNFLSRFLGGNGFQSHLHGNRLIGETFMVAGDETEAAAAEKKLGRRGREKKWSLERRRCRDAVWMEKNKFGLPEEVPESGGSMELMLFPAPAPTAFYMLPPVQEEQQKQPLAMLDEVFDKLHDSRASTRESALATLAGALEGFINYGESSYYAGGPCDAVIRRCCASVKKGASAKESTLALRSVALLAVTFRGGDGARRIMAEAFPLASRIVAESNDVALLLAAVDCLAVVAFVDVDAEDSVDDTEACLDSIWGLICPSTSPNLAVAAARTAAPASPRVLAAALSAWTLVLTTTGGWKGIPRMWRGDTAAHLAGMLYSDSRAVRIAAGEALAVSIEMKLLTRHKNGGLLKDLEERAADLAIEAAGAGVVKDGFLEQKDLFRKIASYLAGGKPPESSVRTSSSNYGVLTTSTWKDMIRLNFFRRFLGGGFLSHVQGEGLMRQVFTVKDDEVAGKLSAARSKRSLKKELNGAMSMDKKQDKQRGVKKDRLTSYELKHGTDL